MNDNWQTFRANYKNNPIAADRLRYDILFHSDLSRDKGQSNGLDLAHINWGNYDLIVIDESHNFRNGGNVDEEEGQEEDADRKENRYQRLMNRVIRQGVKTKVLMLSATPVLPTMPRKSISTKSSSSYWIGPMTKLSKISRLSKEGIDSWQQ